MGFLGYHRIRCMPQVTLFAPELAAMPFPPREPLMPSPSYTLMPPPPCPPPHLNKSRCAGTAARMAGKGQLVIHGVLKQSKGGTALKTVSD